MAKLNEYMRNEYLEIILYISFIAVSLLLVTYAGFSLKGFSEQILGESIDVQSYLGTILTYIPLLLLAILLIIFPIVSLLTLRKGQHPVEADHPRWWQIFSVSYIYSPENGLLYRLAEATNTQGIKRWLNFPRITIISLFIFTFIGIFQIANPTLNFFTAPTQQVTTTANVIFGSVVPAFSENGGLLFFYFLLLGITTYFLTKTIPDKKVRLGLFFTIAFLLLFLGAYSWQSFHTIVYGNDVSKQVFTFAFGFFGLFITLLTGTLIPFAIAHITNNGAIILRNALDPSSIPILFIIWIILFALYIVSEVFVRRIRRN